MVWAFRASLLAMALPLAATPAVAQVGYPVHHHHAVHARKVVHQASGLGVTIDQARLITFPKPVKTVFVGNPTVVDVSMIVGQARPPKSSEVVSLLGSHPISKTFFPC